MVVPMRLAISRDGSCRKISQREMTEVNKLLQLKYLLASGSTINTVLANGLEAQGSILRYLQPKNDFVIL
jgi:hypothetical protein